MTPDRPAQRRRMTSPLLEMDGLEEPVPVTPARSEEELAMEPVMSTTSLAQIVRHEIHNGLGPLQVEMANLSTKVATRLNEIEGVLKDQDASILHLQKLLEGHGSNASTPRSANAAATLEDHENQLGELRRKLEALNVTPQEHRPDAHWEVSKTMAVGGLVELGSLQEATKWLSNKLSEFGGPHHIGTYMKSDAFNGFLFAKFKNVDARDTAVALMRSASIKVGEKHVWASQDLPVSIRARKLFLFRLRWQLGQWGFTKQEMVVDEEYSKLSIANKVIVKVETAGTNLQVHWADEWARWQDFQDSMELQDICEKSRVLLNKVGKGGGKSKNAPAVL